MIKGLGLYSPAGVVDLDGSGHEAGDVREELRTVRAALDADPESFVWLGLFEPTRAELDQVAGEFSLPHLQVEDAANPEQRAKVEASGPERIFCLVKALDYVERSSDVRTGQVAIFIGPRYAITVRFGQTADLGGIRERLAESESLRSAGPISVLYCLLDRIVDEYLHVTDEISNDISEVETEVFAETPGPDIAGRIYRLKRESVEIGRAIGPLVPTAHAAATGDMPWVPDDMRPYFRDIGEHLLRASDATASADSLLLTMLMASTARLDLKQNRDVRKISAWVAMAAVPTMIAGIYGMNFDTMPELHQPWGYPVVLGVMAGTCALMYRAFKKSGWL